MLVWKTQTLKVTVASLRYRCLLPLRYLAQQGMRSTICAGSQRVRLTPHTYAIIFVKSFREDDVKTCERAYQLNVPIILDLCDNIFIDEYAADNDYAPDQNFRLMAQRAAAIVTTGSALKAEVEKVLATLNLQRLVVVIPDGNESLEDVDFAFRATRWQRLLMAQAMNQVEMSWLKPWNKAAPDVKTVLWFGNHGAKYGNFGMLDILDVADALEALSQRQLLRLRVVSNSYEKYSTYIAPLPFESDYLPWHPRKIYDYIRASDVVIIPNSQSAFSICKSANRAVLALSQGTPVVASRTPALEMFAECIWLDDWAKGLQSYLQQPDVAQAHVDQAQRVIEQKLSGEAIAQQWLSLISHINNDQKACHDSR